MHIVWDWNGTLLADMPAVLDAVNVGLRPYRSEPVTLDEYRTHYTRPVKQFYDLLLDRTLDHSEWLDIDARYHAAYAESLGELELAGDALEALGRVEASAHSQSLLSMYPHDALVPLVAEAGIASYFARVDGLRGPAGDRKAGYLAQHLGAMGVDPPSTLVVGDTPDDLAAARSVGAGAVLVTGGGHHRSTLESAGATVVDSLVEAIRGVPGI